MGVVGIEGQETVFVGLEALRDGDREGGIRSGVLLRSSWAIATRLLWSSKADSGEIGVLCLWVVLCCGTGALFVGFNGFVYVFADKESSARERSHNGFVPIMWAR